MIEYRKGCAGIFILLRLWGTSWPHGIIPGLVSASIGLALSFVPQLNETISDKTKFVDNPYAYQLFAYLVGFVLVFRTNFGYGRYWEAVDAVQRMGSKWLDAALMSVAFDAKGDATMPFLQSSVLEGDDVDEVVKISSEMQNSAMSLTRLCAQGLSHSEFFIEITHLFSLMHALALQHLRNDTNLENLCVASDLMVSRLSHMGNEPEKSHSKSTVASMRILSKMSTLNLSVIGGIIEAQKQVLERDSQGSEIPGLARVTMVESWIMRRLIARQKFEPNGDLGKTPPPITSRLVQNISDGNLAFSQAAKSADTPFPFPYHNLIRIFLWIFGASAPFIVNAKIMWYPTRFIVNFMAVWAYFSLAEVGDNLEDPYIPYDPNELPLESFHHHFNARLLSLGVVPKAYERGELSLE
eukprot:TRINITY_DN56982_c0_g1_i1.p1 TRINITY_DN56982_c0_g1~~TRINITY_DN56982_c0_g1_i1.p1  ORF type:complete len:411 (-),score=70.91 TRINITY_DN56982_c0_g1_i1:63-1295(-)